MDLEGVSRAAAVQSNSAYQVKVQNTAKDSQEAVVGKLVDSIDASSPDRANFSTGQGLDVKG